MKPLPRRTPIELTDEEREVVQTLWQFWDEGNVDAFTVLAASWPVVAGRLLFSAYDQGLRWENEKRFLAQEAVGRA